MFPLIWTFISSQGFISGVGSDANGLTQNIDLSMFWSDDYRLPMSIFIGFLDDVNLFWIPSEKSYAIFEPNDPNGPEMVVQGFSKFNALQGFYKFHGMICGCSSHGPFIVDTDGSMRERTGTRDFGVLSSGLWIYQGVQEKVLTGSFVAPISMQGATTAELLSIAIVLYLFTVKRTERPVVIRTDSMNSVKYIDNGKIGVEGKKLVPLINLCRSLKDELERDGMVISVQHIPNRYDGKAICKQRNNAHEIAYKTGILERDAEMPKMVYNFAGKEETLPKLILDALLQCEAIYCGKSGAFPYLAQCGLRSLHE